MRKRGVKEITLLACTHAAILWQSQSSNPGLTDSKVRFTSEWQRLWVLHFLEIWPWSIAELSQDPHFFSWCGVCEDNKWVLKALEVLSWVHTPDTDHLLLFPFKILLCSFYVSTWLGYSAQTFAQTLFWMLLWGCFFGWASITFESVDFELSRFPDII